MEAVKSTQEGCAYHKIDMGLGTHPGNRKIVKHAPPQPTQLGSTGSWSTSKPRKVSIEGTPRG